MARKGRIASLAAAALGMAGAMGLGGMSSPVGQEVVTAQQNVQVVQQAPQQQAKASQQQQAKQQQQRVVTPQTVYYMPWAPGDHVYGKMSLSPKEYGEYLMRSGKNKYNGRKRKQWAKARA